MMREHIISVLLVTVILLTTVSAQSVEIGGTSAIIASNHRMTCTLVGSVATNLQYRWRLGDDVLQNFSPNSDLPFPGVSISDAQDNYHCDIRVPGMPDVTGTASLNVAIQNFSMAFTRNTETIRFPYVGSNISYSCRTLFGGSLSGLSGEVDIVDPNGTLIGSSGRVRVSEITVATNDFERTLYFSPLSAEDVGDYRCTGTIQPITANPLVTNGMGSTIQSVSILPLQLSVEVSPVTQRYLDIQPYNLLSLECSAAITVRSDPVPLNIEFTWLKSLDSGPFVELTSDLYTNGRVFASSATSNFTVRVQEGNHTYMCQVNLDVDPAPDEIMDQRSVNVEVTGPADPLLPDNLATPSESLFHNRATVQWVVTSLSYGPETYRVLYGLPGTELANESTVVLSGTDISRVNFTLSVELTGLMVSTMYQYQLQVNNTVSVLRSPIQSFTTTNLPPEPPGGLRADRSDTVLTTYGFTWTPPPVVNGELSQYELTCQPTDGRSPTLTMTFDPAETSGDLTGFEFGVSYECVVQARNMAALSLPSNTVSITVTESVPGAVTCAERWTNTVIRPDQSGVDVTVTWQLSTNENGIIIGYTLNFTSYDGTELLESVTVSATTTSHTFTRLSLGVGVPYSVSVTAMNSAGSSLEPCYLTDFSDQRPPPPVSGLILSRETATEIVLEWTVPSLVEAGGFLEYEVRYQPVLTSEGTRRKRQDVRAACTQSPCVVPVGEGGVTIIGLNGDLGYTVTVQPYNSERESGTAVVQTVPAMGEEFPLLPVVVGVVVGSLFLAILLILCLIIILCCCRRKKNRQFGMEPRPRPLQNMELEKKRDYVNDTELGESPPPLYSAVAVKDRLRLIPIAQFTYHVEDMHANRDAKFEVEYESLGNDTLASLEIAKLNKAKNRFANIFPYDFSRVKLEIVDGKDGSDYINASYIDGYKQANAYIAAQGPMPNTISDHWRMIWEHKLTAVIMLTKVSEAGKKKCEQYWPDAVGQTMMQPDTTLEVTLREHLPFADYEIRKLEVHDVSKECNEVPLSVIQYHFLGWPDHGVPKFATSLIEFIRRVRHSYRSDRPILVHCGAGVGRTGTYITLDSMLERMKEVDNINVYEFVRNMRAKRVLMVQTQAQYMFIHDALEELITCGETSIQAPLLRDAINTLNKVDPNTATTGFEEQFMLLNKVSRIPTDSDLSDALQHYNEKKNRYQDKIPYNTNRVRLRPCSTSGAEYVNASFVDGYKHRNAYIATQAPLQTTVEDFWRMIWEFKSKVIVLLCPTEEDGQEACYQYWPEKEGVGLTIGKLLVTLLSEKMEKEFIERTIEIKEERADGTPGQGFTVTQYHYQHWPEHDRPPTSTGLLQLIKSLNRAQRNTGNKPVTVMCNDGVGRTGSFICVHAMLERVNTENIVDFFQFIKSSRIHRPSLVLELEHYRFCHDMLADYLNSLDSYANFKDLS